MIPNRNVLWGRVLARELASGGVRDVVASPGARSTPLTFALHEAGFRVTLIHDERSAAYFALGASKAQAAPVALVCTSGTAVANWWPAVVEAHHAGVPLLLLTADRPPELHGLGANQTINQDRIFGSFVRHAADVGLPAATREAVSRLKTHVAKALDVAQAAPQGPVHLNFPFREPLAPDRVPGDVAEEWESEYGGAPEPTPKAPRSRPATSASKKELGPLIEWAARHRRGLLIASGPDSAEAATSLRALAKALGYPLVADALSGARFGPTEGATVVSAYDAFLTHAATRERLRPEVVLRFGSAPVSKSLLSWLESLSDVPQATVNEFGWAWHPTSASHVILQADPAAVAQALLNAVPKAAARRDGAWEREWESVEASARAVLDRETGSRSFEGAVAAHVVASLPEGATLFVSNSLPVRDVDRFAAARTQPLAVRSNRGASGIDGVLSTALGAASVASATTLLIGDLALLHDLNALVTARRMRIPIDIVLVNNDGGGIFELLPVAEHEPPFTDLVVAPHGTDFGAVARAVGLPFRSVATPADVAQALRDRGPFPRIVEFPSDRRENVRHRREIEAVLHRELERLGEAPVRAR